MCGRYSLTLSWEDLCGAWKIGGVLNPPWQPRYNVAPGQDILVLGQSKDDGIHPAYVRWGMPFPHGLLINARMERLQSDARYRHALNAGQRVVIPADGFYEWAKSSKQPFRFVGPGPLNIAGLLLRSAEAPPWRIVLITCAASRWMEGIHARMPWLLTSDQVPLWLDRSSAQYRALVPKEDVVLTHYPVSRRLNSSQEDSPELIAQVPDS
jgi:putative SOS response-associated peptidase YedK